jgi:hypothetical protein
MKPSPAPRQGGQRLNPWSSVFGKFPKIPVNRISNQQATATITNAALPRQVMDPSGFMRSFVRSGYETMSKGVHGEVFTVANKPKLEEMYDTLLQNKITCKNPRAIPDGIKVVVKVISVPGDERNFWGPNVFRFTQAFLRDVTERTIQQHAEKFGGDINSMRMQQHKVTKEKFASLHAEERERHLLRHKWSQQKTSWKEILHEGATDATNHLHLMRALPMRIDVPNGEISLKATDVIPEFYFSGSSAEHGVYVIVMGVAAGTSAARKRTFSPKLIANIEKALLTLAVVGVEHGDLHTGNIMVHKDSVQLIDFGMSSVLPDKYRVRAARGITTAVNTLLETGSWPEKASNNIWYDPENGTMRYLNSYMMNKHGKNFSWYNPSGKLLRFVKTHAEKRDLDAARYQVWSAAVRHYPKRKKTPSPKVAQKQPRIVLNYSNL